jgi:putative oxidoreductase
MHSLSRKLVAVYVLTKPLISSRASLGIFVLRVSIGIDWLVHAFLKIYRGMWTHEALLQKHGITPLLAWPTFGLEVLGGASILLGLYTRQWSAFLLIFLGVIIWVKWPNGWNYSNAGGGWEYPLFWLLAQLGLTLTDGGAFALQMVLRSRPPAANR